MKAILVSILLFLPLALRAHGTTTLATDTVETATRSTWRYDEAYRHIVLSPVLPDSADVFRQQKKHFWRAAAETVGFNIGLWAFDRYVINGHFAYISWNTIKENFKHGFEWDDDHPTSIEMSEGGKMLTLWDYDEGTRAGAAATINIEYGDKFAEKPKAPYDYFSLLM